MLWAALKHGQHHVDISFCMLLLSLLPQVLLTVMVQHSICAQPWIVSYFVTKRNDNNKNKLTKTTTTSMVAITSTIATVCQLPNHPEQSPQPSKHCHCCFCCSSCCCYYSCCCVSLFHNSLTTSHINDDSQLLCCQLAIFLANACHTHTHVLLLLQHAVGSLQVASYQLLVYCNPISWRSSEGMKKAALY